MPRLSQALLLNKYILHQFGVKDLQALSENLRDAIHEGYDENHVSHFHRQLVQRFYTNANLPESLLFEYDQNIVSHTLRISQSRSQPVHWKYFQYVALLFTEIFLDRYFRDTDALLADINQFWEDRFDRSTGVDKYTDKSELTKLAFWNATGSGKTLLMHVNILQYQYYLKKYGKQKDLNRIIVLTPNEGLSRQHLTEFRQSGLDAELFSKTGGALYVGQKIEIIDISKLRETSGEKTVAIEAFESNNLVLIDEGHRGSGGEVWKDYRNRLSAEGFSFEYSATFGQAVNAQTGKRQRDILNEYGRSILFDYSYRYFYADGYGKDYHILNLTKTQSDDFTTRYLTACLLTYFEQLLLYRNERGSATTFGIEKPLAIFVGSKVTAVRTENGKKVSDVLQVLQFLADFVKHTVRSQRDIDLLMKAQDGLVDKAGHSIFGNSFRYLRQKGLDSQQLFTQLLADVFNNSSANALLHIDNLKGQDGEIGLRLGNADYFGVINVGDDAALLKLCDEAGLLTDEKEFSASLFRSINAPGSSVNVLIGSKKFAEGWSSWRVSTMGLLNIGRGEGSEIIQLFGRGVRLKGYQFSLKRSSQLDQSVRPAVLPEYLSRLETLNIFGIRADYMDRFKEYLEGEGLKSGDEEQPIELTLPILPVVDLAKKGLKYVRFREGRDFKKQQVVRLIGKPMYPVRLDWYPKVQLMQSASRNTLSQVAVVETHLLTEQHIAFLDIKKLYAALLTYKNERGWYNIDLRREDLIAALHDASWYELTIPAEQLDFIDFDQVRTWQEIATSLLKGYCERIYNQARSMYNAEHPETALLDTSHPNFEKEYRLSIIEAGNEILIDNLRQLQKALKAGQFAADCRLGTRFDALHVLPHLYQPLLHMDAKSYQDAVSIQPVSLNEGERRFVEDLRKAVQNGHSLLNGGTIHLLRNQSRKGIGFFEANNFYPDFLLWIVQDEHQHLAFIDPKGLRNFSGFDEPKIQFSRRIQTEIEPKLNDPALHLSSFIVSVTPYERLKSWGGLPPIEEFNVNNIYFQTQQSTEYIEKILVKMLSAKTI
ncbi:DEAD/DEAH box helicase family protein [Spirosoma panaciterrae]|uniref:DEAD/DEAH box helicase family protein n=1 Tax=Spirosoma panaciterrae TaxID=496058 RepID=UPI00036031EC|nr:DEAD/DEAH box helicase family protein [Spirosoma panaciterrae]